MAKSWLRSIIAGNFRWATPRRTLQRLSKKIIKSEERSLKEEMFVLDDITLIVGIAVLLLAIIVPFVNVLVVRLKGGQAHCGDEDGDDDTVEMADNGAEKQLPGISVVVTVEEDGEELRDRFFLLFRLDHFY